VNPQPQSHPKLTPQVGKPETIALKRPGSIVGSRIAGAPNQAYYQLQDGRSMYLPLQVGAMIDQLKLQPGEPFTLLKRGPGSWDVRRLSAPPQTSPSAPLNGAGEDARGDPEALLRPGHPDRAGGRRKRQAPRVDGDPEL
jgi:hypothetical protein